jgi:hypothetical protein
LTFFECKTAKRVYNFVISETKKIMKKLILCLSLAAFTFAVQAGDSCCPKTKAECKDKAKAECPFMKGDKSCCPKAKEDAKAPIQSPKAAAEPYK